MNLRAWMLSVFHSEYRFLSDDGTRQQDDPNQQRRRLERYQAELLLETVSSPFAHIRNSRTEKEDASHHA
jgi:hypothetical protein